MPYFDKFETVFYDNFQIKNLLSRVKMTDVAKEYATAFLPYTIKEGDTPYQVAFDYYDTVDLTWLVYMSNDIIDPHYGWYMDTRKFEAYIEKKYGSIEAAQSNLEGYKDNLDTSIEYSVDTYTYYEGSADKTQWVPIYSYNRESEENDAKLSIKLLDKRFSGVAEKNLVALLNE